MNVLDNLNRHLKNNNVAPHLIALILSSLLLGYAFSSILVGLLFFYSFINAGYYKRKIDLKFQLLLPVLLYLFFCATYFWSVDKDLTLKGLGRLVSLLIIPITFALLAKFKKADLMLVLNIFTKANILYSVFFLITSYLRYQESGILSEFTYHELVSNLDLNAIYVSVYFLISLFYLLSKTKKQTVDFFQILFFVVMLFLLSSKIVIGVLSISMFIYLILDNKRIIRNKRKFLILVTLLIFIGGVFSTEIITRLKEEKKINIEEVLYSKEFGKVYPWTGVSIRLLQLRILSEQVKEQQIFWTGFGVFASRKSLNEYHTIYNTYEAFHRYNYHNMYAQIFSETGILGLLILIIILVSNFLKAIKSRSFLFLMFGLLMPFWFMTESVLWVHRGVLLFMVFYCLFNRTDFNDSRNSSLAHY